MISMGKAWGVWKKDKKIVKARRKGRLVASQWVDWLPAIMVSGLSGLLSCFLRSGETGGGEFSLPDFKARSSARMLLRVVFVVLDQGRVVYRLHVLSNQKAFLKPLLLCW